MTKKGAFSMFASLSDPSLKGNKFKINFFHDDMNKLPTIKKPGDIIVMHRVKVSFFRGALQGLGIGSAGFSAVVFPRMPDDAQPYPSLSVCSFTPDDLKRVCALRLWWNSSECPVEKEEITLPAVGTHTIQPSSVSLTLCTRLHLSNAPAYINIEGQVVGITKFSHGGDVVLHLWDGEPTPRTPGCPRNRFFTVHDCVRPDLGACKLSVRLDPLLAIVTGHKLGHLKCDDDDDESVVDWTVPVFVYDEHAETVTTSIHPGAIIRIVNLHVIRKVFLPNSNEAARMDNKLKLDVHGGGARYGRRIEVLQDDSVSPLHRRLQVGLKQRTPFAIPNLPTRLKPTQSELSNPPTLESRPSLSLVKLVQIIIADVMSLPINHAHVGNAASQSFLEEQHKQLPWIAVSDEEVEGSEANGERYITVHVRVLARITQASPATNDALASHILLVCPICKVANHLSSAETSEHDYSCSCRQVMPRKRPAVASHRSRLLLPVFSVILEDCSGEMSVLVTGNAIKNLLPTTSSSTFQEDLVRSMTTTKNSISTESSEQRLIDAWHNLVVEGTEKCGWVDAVISVSWLPSVNEELQNFCFNMVDCRLKTG